MVDISCRGNGSKGKEFNVCDTISMEVEELWTEEKVP